MSSRRASFALPPRWNQEELDRDRMMAVEAFRRERLEEPAGEYGLAYAIARNAVDELFARTSDLLDTENAALLVLSNPLTRDALRYTAGPPVSLDDLKTLVDAPSIAPTALARNPELVKRLIETIFAAMDHGRFPWLREGRAALPEERAAAILATSTLIATQRVATDRRTRGKRAQEDRVRAALIELQLSNVTIPGGVIRNVRDVPPPGHFCTETTLITRKADLIVGLWDGRCTPIECKVSNSSINSIKRLNNDAAVKAEAWRSDLGASNIVPVAMLSGVYWLPQLVEAQERGLTLMWAHRLDDLTAFIESTRPD
jgi:XamI restriction endonuclease